MDQCYFKTLDWNGFGMRNKINDWANSNEYLWYNWNGPFPHHIPFLVGTYADGLFSNLQSEGMCTSAYCNWILKRVWNAEVTGSHHCCRRPVFHWVCLWSVLSWFKIGVWSFRPRLYFMKDKNTWVWLKNNKPLL